MKEIRNYKNIRRKPEIYGFTPNGFYTFVAIAILSLAIFFGGFTLFKLIIVAIINGISIVFTKLIMSNDNLLKRLFNENWKNVIIELSNNDENIIKHLDTYYK